jgi:hypothetical protein
MTYEQLRTLVSSPSDRCIAAILCADFRALSQDLEVPILILSASP